MINWQNRVFPNYTVFHEYGKLIIEGSSSRVSLHGLFVFANIIIRAKKLRPVIVSSSSQYKLIDTMAKEYFEDFEIYEEAQLSLFKKTKLVLNAIVIWVKSILKQDVLSQKWQDVVIGDMVYDEYLRACKKATLHYSDPRILKYFYIVIRSIYKASLIFDNTGPAAVLVSHKVGISGAPIAQIAEDRGLPIYSFQGEVSCAFMRSMQRKTYEFSPTEKDINLLLGMPDIDFENLFQNVKKRVFAGEVLPEANVAFSKKLYKSRHEFAEQFGLMQGRKNIFIMLHLFNDYPHSIFNGMLFCDYYDWFVQTLNLIKGVSDVNWIIKEHWASKYYLTEDFSFKKMKNEYSSYEQMFFMPGDCDFNTESIAYVGDAIITCSGSAGFELSALGGLPSITAGHNAYTNCGFANFPDTQDDYFELLKNAKNLEKLDKQRHKRAKATFIVIHHIARVRMQLFPSLSLGERISMQFTDEYFNKIEAAIEGHEAQIIADVECYIREVSRPNFQSLRRDTSNISE